MLTPLHFNEVNSVLRMLAGVSEKGPQPKSYLGVGEETNISRYLRLGNPMFLKLVSYGPDGLFDCCGMYGG